jgi:hypothetical protein
MFRVVMLPARRGDCIWLEYGEARKPRRVMIDGGPPEAARGILTWLPDGPVHFELLAITHIDSDHVGGALELLARLPANVTFGDVWFNAWKHLPPSDVLGAAQAEMLSEVITRRKLPWNRAFGGRAARIPARGALPSFELDGGLTITLLSPSNEELRALTPVWEEEAEKAGIVPGSREDAAALLERRLGPLDILGRVPEGPPKPERDAAEEFESDDSEANGTSLVLLAEYQGKRLLLCGDAFPSVVKRGIARLRESGKVKLDAMTVPHHGSRRNTDRELIESIHCARYLVSTDGSYYAHPDNAALARVVVYGGQHCTLYFNYGRPKAKRWAAQRLRDRYGYDVVFPAPRATGLRLSL